MRIGVDATCWTHRRGYGRFARALLTATLAVDPSREYVFFVDDETEEFPLPRGVEVVRVAAEVPTVRAAAANGRRSLPDMWAVSRAISGRSLDAVFFPSVYSYVPLLTAAPKLVTIHDVIPELFPELVFPHWRSRLFWAAKVKLACAQARLILTVSDYSRRRLAEQLKISPARIRVVPEAGDPAFRPLQETDAAAFRARWKLAPDARFLAYVGGFSPHKNLGLLVEVLGELRARPGLGNLYLMLVGDYQGDVFYSCYRELAAQVHAAGLQEHVVFTGYLADEDLVQLCNLAEALVLPSFCEGFGLPAVEAAACGTPAVVTTESPLVELLGEGAIGVEPRDRRGWVSALASVLGDPRRRASMRAAALAATARLSWENAARQLLSIFDEVLTTRVAAH